MTDKIPAKTVKYANKRYSEQKASVNENQEIVDRFEGTIAVVEIDGKGRKDFPKKPLPKGVKVGDILLIDGDNITISKEGTEKLRKEIEDLMDELVED